MSRLAKRGVDAGLVLTGRLALSASAHAQLAGSITAASSEMFRGESISGGDPVVAASVSLDTRSGLFAVISASIAHDPEVPRVSALVQYAGFARQQGKVTLEAGVIHRSYARIVDSDYRRAFFEGFAGVGAGAVRTRFYVSPDYLRDGRASYYAEVNAPLLRHDKWRLEGHAGLSLIPYDRDAGRGGLRRYTDWRLTLTRPVGPLFLALGVNGTNYPVYSETGRARVFGSAAWAF